MKPKYLAAGLIAFSAVIGWNVFLVQRDDAMYKEYYRRQAIENIKHPPSKDIAYSPKERFCRSQANWHPDCNVE
jgi:hypothetical protein